MGFLITLWYMYIYALFTPSQTLSCLLNPQLPTSNHPCVFVSLGFAMPFALG